MIVEAFRPRDIETVGMATNNVTFTEFLKYIVTYTGYMTSNDHWQKYEQLCFPCAFEYDFIGHFETLKEDARLFAEKGGNRQPRGFPASSFVKGHLRFYDVLLTSSTRGYF
ncbi:Carbohydrate sulfotransferase 14 [Desmophyllum pertusum]|uniref:Carbohydrate sulfotransferase n=1 Tax=Desmophyllum pertusum TaxID=174260 RepID=A0A9X0CGQ5_9CNID|nr:Carbohydrate sulfotransferase 14 [Desmophyllum pertusum]